MHTFGENQEAPQSTPPWGRNGQENWSVTRFNSPVPIVAGSNSVWEGLLFGAAPRNEIRPVKVYTPVDVNIYKHNDIVY